MRNALLSLLLLLPGCTAPAGAALLWNYTAAMATPSGSSVPSTGYQRAYANCLETQAKYAHQSDADKTVREIKELTKDCDALATKTARLWVMPVYDTGPSVFLSLPTSTGTVTVGY